MGAGSESTSGLCLERTPRNSRPHLGGQASSPGLFGLPSATGRARQQVAAPKADDTARKVGGLTFGQRRRLIGAQIDRAAVSLGNYERRRMPAGPSMESLIAAARARKAAQDDEQASPKATPAMLVVAYASDMREAFAHHQDDEEADFVRRCAGAGFVEATLAMEGN